MNSLVAQRSPEESLAFLALWTQQLLVELRFAQNAGRFIGVPSDVTLAVNVGLAAVGKTPIFIGEADFQAYCSLRAYERAREEEWWALH